jgi:hypothetical protein
MRSLLCAMAPSARLLMVALWHCRERTSPQVPCMLSDNLGSADLRDIQPGWRVIFKHIIRQDIHISRFKDHLGPFSTLASTARWRLLITGLLLFPLPFWIGPPARALVIIVIITTTTAPS